MKNRDEQNSILDSVLAQFIVQRAQLSADKSALLAQAVAQVSADLALEEIKVSR